MKSVLSFNFFKTLTSVKTNYNIYTYIFPVLALAINQMLRVYNAVIIILDLLRAN